MMKVHSYRDYVKKYPDCPKEIPMSLLNEANAFGIHGQSLERLNERGGLSPIEIIGNIRNLPYSAFDSLNEGECIKQINQLLKSR